MAVTIRVCLVLCAWLAWSASALASLQNPSNPERTESSKCDNAQEHLVSVNGLRVHYLEAGTGPTMVLIHGNAGSVNDFSYRTIRLLCSEYKIVAVDRPGHGKSDRLAKDPARLESQAALLHETLALLGIKRPILVGHSWGSSLALAYTLHYQDDVSSMILLAPAAYSEDEEDSWWMTTFIKPPVIGDVSLTLGKLLFGKRMLKKELKLAFDPQPLPDDYLKSANSWLGRKQLRSYIEDESRLNKNLEALSRRYPEIHIPVIIVTGDSDKITPPKANAYRLKAAISQSQLIELKHTGHEIPQTNPQSIRTALGMISSSTAYGNIR